jgi:hypothetical protein
VGRFLTEIPKITPITEDKPKQPHHTTEGPNNQEAYNNITKHPEQNTIRRSWRNNQDQDPGKGRLKLGEA